MIKPVFVPNFERKIMSLFKAPVGLNQGAIVDVDPNDTTAVSASGGVGFGTLYAGSLKLFTSAVVPAVASAQVFSRPLGITVVTVNTTGPTLIERLLELASSYTTIAEGMNAALYLPSPGDIIATSEYVGNLTGDSSLTGYINNASTGNFNAACEVYQGRFRLAQAGNFCSARYLGNTTASGAVLGVFQIQ